MSTPGEEKEWRANDQIGAANSTNHEEPIATEPLQRVGTEKELNVETQMDPEAEDSEKQINGNTISRETSGTETSENGSDTKSEKREPVKRSWGERLNPLKTKHKPPVPAERQPSREYGANILSIITFQWISPLMRVSTRLSTNANVLNIF